MWKSVSDLYDTHTGLQVDEVFLRGYNAALGDVRLSSPAVGRKLYGEDENSEIKHD